MEMMKVHWQKCRYNLFWCRLDSELLDDPRLEFTGGVHRLGIMGVYIIWAGLDNRVILKVGSGIIRDRFRAHLRDPKVQAYKNKGLYATWAPILFVDKPVDKRRGVERFLGRILKPKLTERLPENVDPIFVNIPVWDKPANPFLSGIFSSRNQFKDGNPFRLTSQPDRLAEYLKGSSRNQLGQTPVKDGNPFRLTSQPDRLAEYLKGNKLSK